MNIFAELRKLELKRGIKIEVILDLEADAGTFYGAACEDDLFSDDVSRFVEIPFLTKEFIEKYEDIFHEYGHNGEILYHVKPKQISDLKYVIDSLGTSQAARELNVSRPTLQRWAAEGRPTKVADKERITKLVKKLQDKELEKGFTTYRKV